MATTLLAAVPVSMLVVAFPPLFALLDPPLAWALAGALLCLLEVVLPTDFIFFALGASAFGVALVALLLPQVSLQVGLWLLLSVAIVIGLRQWARAGRSPAIAEATTAETIADIPAGKTGRVGVVGVWWRARCADDAIAVPSGQDVLVLGREGNTLIVMPEQLLSAELEA